MLACIIKYFAALPLKVDSISFVPKVSMHPEHVMKRTMDQYNDNLEDKLPSITPHVLRYTFCTEMANSGIDLKSLQYLTKHSDAGVTLNVYTHASYEAAESAIRKAVGNG